jgi:hypothetical protein
VHGDPVVDVAVHLAADDLEGFGGIERDDIVDVHRDHEGRRGRLGLRDRRRERRPEHQRERAKPSVHCSSPGILS